ncbi:MAG: hypothetical protein ACK4E3_01810 [Brevundimonas sp.]|jgi:hypothetical protein|uniref:hypothetical protein n=1 Tax=Brevundimonas sp. TaxID=1871086 RepID=UPI003918C2EB
MTMPKVIPLGALALLLAACGAYEANPTSPYQWEQRQARIERDYQETLARCRTLDRASERFQRECAGLREFRADDTQEGGS